MDLSVSSLGSEQIFATKQQSELSELSSYDDMDYEDMTDDELMTVSQEFEALFIKEIFDSMRETLSGDQLLDGGMQQEVFEDMLYDEYSLLAAESGGIGLAQMVYDSLSGYSNATSEYASASAVDDTVSESAEIDQEA